MLKTLLETKWETLLPAPLSIYLLPCGSLSLQSWAWKLVALLVSMSSPPTMLSSTLCFLRRAHFPLICSHRNGWTFIAKSRGQFWVPLLVFFNLSGTFATVSLRLLNGTVFLQSLQFRRSRVLYVLPLSSVIFSYGVHGPAYLVVAANSV